MARALSKSTARAKAGSRMTGCAGAGRGDNSSSPRIFAILDPLTDQFRFSHVIHIREQFIFSRQRGRTIG